MQYPILSMLYKFNLEPLNHKNTFFYKLQQPTFKILDV